MLFLRNIFSNKLCVPNWPWCICCGAAKSCYVALHYGCFGTLYVIRTCNLKTMDALKHKSRFTKKHHYIITLHNICFLILPLYTVVLNNPSTFLARRQEPVLVWGAPRWHQVWSVQEEPLHTALKELQNHVRTPQDHLHAALTQKRWQILPSALLAVLLHRRPAKVRHNRPVSPTAAAPGAQVQHHEGAALVDQKTLW